MTARSDAERLLARRADLPQAETLAMLWLLSRADNDTCALPVQFTPKHAELATWLRCTPRHLRRVLAHLELHGWIKRVPGQEPAARAPMPCCPAWSRAAATADRKKGTRVSPFYRRKGTRVSPKKGDIVRCSAAGQRRFSTEGSSEGEGVEGR